jgi:hypothetical protein
MTVAQIVAVMLSACSIVISVLSVRMSRQSRREFEKTMASYQVILNHAAEPQDLGTRILAKTARQAEAMRRVGRPQ